MQFTVRSNDLVSLLFDAKRCCYLSWQKALELASTQRLVFGRKLIGLQYLQVFQVMTFFRLCTFVYIERLERLACTL